MKRRKASLAKTILIVIAVLLILAIAGGYAILKFYVKPKADNLVQSLLNDEEIRTMVDEYVQNNLPQTTEAPQQAEPTAVPASSDAGSSGAEALKPDNIVTATQPTVPPEFEKTAPATEAPEQSSPSGSSTDSIRSQVSAQDWSDGMALVGKVDVGYIMGLMSGGLTSEEKQELKEYLTSRLSSGEISRAIELYNKYSHLL